MKGELLVARIGGWCIGLSIATAVGLLINHLVHGAGCWGAQPGGHLSAGLYFLQCLVAVAAGATAAFFHFRDPGTGGWLRGILALGAVIGTGILFYTDGWDIYTTIHGQGMENLIPFGAACLAGIYGGIVCRRNPSGTTKARSPRIGSLRIALKAFLTVVGFLLIWFVVIRLKSGENMLRLSGQAPDIEGWEGNIRIGCYNLAHGRGSEPGGSNWGGGSEEERSARLIAIADLIRTQDLDLLILNEMDFDCTWSHGVNQAAILGDACGFRYRLEQRNLDLGIPFMRVAIGNAILSRFPIKDAETVDFPPVNWWEPLVAGKKRGALGMVRLPNGTELEVFAVHAETRDQEVRKGSVKALLKRAGESSILAGDFNSVRQGNGTTAVDLIFGDGRWMASTASTGTFPTVEPRRRIDWIFVPKSWREVESRVLVSDLSDHALVIGEWRISEVQPD